MDEWPGLCFENYEKMTTRWLRRIVYLFCWTFEISQRYLWDISEISQRYLWDRLWVHRVLLCQLVSTILLVSLNGTDFTRNEAYSCKLRPFVGSKSKDKSKLIFDPWGMHAWGVSLDRLTRCLLNDFIQRLHSTSINICLCFAGVLQQW